MWTKKQKNIQQDQREWAKNGREKDIVYIERTRPNVFEEIEKYSISTRARAEYVEKIYSFLESKMKLNNEDPENFLQAINYLSILDSCIKYFWQKKQDSSEKVPEVCCSFVIAKEVLDILNCEGDLYAKITSKPSNKQKYVNQTLPKIQDNMFFCTFSPNVKEYSIEYFYQGLSEAFIKSKSYSVEDVRYTGDLPVLVMLGKSYLKYLKIHVDNIKDNSKKTISHVFRADRITKNIVAENLEKFNKYIAHEYNNTK